MTCPHPCHSPRSRRVAPLGLLLVLLLIIGCVPLTACGSSSSTASTAGSDSGPTAIPVSAEQVTAEGLATAVTDTWTEAMQGLVSLLKDKPEPSTVLSQVQGLKEECVQRLVALGHQRETLSEGAKAQADSLEWSALQDLADEAWYASFNTISSYYAGTDLEFSNLVASFNILTQYSDFELLKSQSPDEAARLGIQ